MSWDGGVNLIVTRCSEAYCLLRMSVDIPLSRIPLKHLNHRTLYGPEPGLANDETVTAGAATKLYLLGQHRARLCVGGPCGSS